MGVGRNVQLGVQKGIPDVNQTFSCVNRHIILYYSSGLAFGTEPKLSIDVSVFIHIDVIS